MDVAKGYRRLTEVIDERHHDELKAIVDQGMLSGNPVTSCWQIFEHFTSIDDEAAKNDQTYITSYIDDAVCLYHIFSGTDITRKEINHLLEVLAGVPNRKMVAAKILLSKVTKNSRKRTSTDTSTIVDDGSKQPRFSKVWRVEDVLNGPTRIACDRVDDGNVASTSAAKDDVPVAMDVHEDASPSTPTPGPSGVKMIRDSHISVFGGVAPPTPNVNMLPFADPAPVTTSNESVIDETVIGLNLSISQVTEPAAVQHPRFPTPPPALIFDQRLMNKVIEMFPDASPDYVRQICYGKVWNDATFEGIADLMLGSEYPKRPQREPSPEIEINPQEQLEMLKAVLPDADPTYLESKAEELAGNKEGMARFIEHAVENKDYPTMKEYLRRTQLSAQQRQYTVEFKVERFVEIFPDPVATFEDPARKSTILTAVDKDYVLIFMRKKYAQLYARDVNMVVERNSSIMAIVRCLDECMTKGQVKKCKCSTFRTPREPENIPLLQELAYIEHKTEILTFLERKKQQDALERQNVKEQGRMQTCSCCYDEEVMPQDILTCAGGCRFCRDCIKRSTEIAMGEGKTRFPCLMAGECESEFILPVLQNVLSPKMFSKLVQKQALAEVKAAGLEDLESCPFCDFASIPAPDDKLFRCLNPECMKESCRLCKEPSHVPLRCDEVEKDEAVKARTFIENKMTEALIRQCWKCGTKFFKEEGCNKMQCVCGAMMCYICRQPVKDYKHFNGQGGDRTDLCPLYTDNYSVNEKNVLQAAINAKKEVDPNQLKNDPTVGLEAQLKTQSTNQPQRARAQLLQMYAARRPIHRFQNFHRFEDLGIVPRRVPYGLPAIHNQNRQALWDQFREPQRLPVFNPLGLDNPYRPAHLPQ